MISKETKERFKSAQSQEGEKSDYRSYTDKITYPSKEKWSSVDRTTELWLRGRLV